MANNLVRTTTYIEPQLLNWAKKKAIDEGMSFYELVNQALRRMFMNWEPVVADKLESAKYEDIFGAPLNFRLNKRRLTRADYYE